MMKNEEIDHSSKNSPTDILRNNKEKQETPAVTAQERESIEQREIEAKLAASRCLTHNQRLLIVAVFGTCLSALMTFLLIYLLNKIRG